MYPPLLRIGEILLALSLDTVLITLVVSLPTRTVFAELVHNVPSVQRLPALVTMLRIADLANKEGMCPPPSSEAQLCVRLDFSISLLVCGLYVTDPAHELVSHLRERDPFVHHARATGDDSVCTSLFLTLFTDG